MTWTIRLNQIRPEEIESVGGKAHSLSVLVRAGIKVPDALCIPVAAYHYYVSRTGLRERILLELNRKSFRDMRWEELWDASLRIRSMFLRTPIPADLYGGLQDEIDDRFGDGAVVVRSSSPGEDSSKTSFAGLHDSYVNMKGVDAILEHVRLVWASLWSDRALLYRQELGLDVEKSAMAVLVQEIVVGERSGVAFGRSPNDESQAIVEAVHGLNAGLVDGTVEPDQWILDRTTAKVLSHIPVPREKWVVPSPDGTRLEPLPANLSGSPPLGDDEVVRVLDLALALERQFHCPQDMEWTFEGNDLYALQSRPITTVSSEKGDQRPWYLSLHRSFENLKVLRRKIEGDLIPAMIEEADALSHRELRGLSDGELADEIDRRIQIQEQWVSIYWTEFIPFAHGMRLFGQVYNDTMGPSDPFEFMDLLGATPLASLERNRMLREMASMIREDPALAEGLRSRKVDSGGEFTKVLKTFLDRFGSLSRPTEGETPASPEISSAFFDLLLEMAKHPPAQERSISLDVETKIANFLSRMGEEKGEFAKELLDLGRASYRLRDDDNIYLGRIERQTSLAIAEGKRRLGDRAGGDAETLGGQDVIGLLRNRDYTPKMRTASTDRSAPVGVKARQIVGQPAGPGLGKGRARVIIDPADLFAFKAGEILVCDALDPNMTFVVPLAAGIVERRGGMLIHGAIIAREYGLPCVTGVPNATTLIPTGEEVTVDGYLGIVTIGTIASSGHNR